MVTRFDRFPGPRAATSGGPWLMVERYDHFPGPRAATSGGPWLMVERFDRFPGPRAATSGGPWFMVTRFDRFPTPGRPLRGHDGLRSRRLSQSPVAVALHVFGGQQLGARIEIDPRLWTGAAKRHQLEGWRLLGRRRREGAADRVLHEPAQGNPRCSARRFAASSNASSKVTVVLMHHGIPCSHQCIDVATGTPDAPRSPRRRSSRRRGCTARR